MATIYIGVFVFTNEWELFEGEVANRDSVFHYFAKNSQTSLCKLLEYREVDCIFPVKNTDMATFFLSVVGSTLEVYYIMIKVGTLMFVLHLAILTNCATNRWRMDTALKLTHYKGSSREVNLVILKGAIKIFLTVSNISQFFWVEMTTQILIGGLDAIELILTVIEKQPARYTSFIDLSVVALVFILIIILFSKTPQNVSIHFLRVL